MPDADLETAKTAATQHGRETFIPSSRRTGVALCLSGGGFRAALFHLGALRRLNETGILRKIDTFSAVSGGSIIAAHLAHCLSRSPESVHTDWEDQVAAPFRRFTARNLRSGPVFRRFLPWHWNWWNTSVGVRALADRYERDLTDLKLKDLPDRPNFIFCATDMAYGVNWIFEKKYVGDFQVGHTKPPDDWPVALAVAASSCFPPIFNPLPLDLRPEQLTGGKIPKGPGRDECIASLRLTDGGNYDNMGLEPVWKDHQFVLVSDGGAPFSNEKDRGLRWRLMRYSHIMSKQAVALRRRWLVSGYITGVLKGAYWGIGSVVKHYEVENPVRYSESLVDGYISQVRTDMDAFSEAEIAALENHGYLVADAAIRRHLTEIRPEPSPLQVPHPSWMDEEKVKKALAQSHKRRALGRW